MDMSWIYWICIKFITLKMRLMAPLLLSFVCVIVPALAATQLPRQAQAACLKVKGFQGYLPVANRMQRAQQLARVTGAGLRAPVKVQADAQQQGGRLKLPRWDGPGTKFVFLY